MFQIDMMVYGATGPGRLGVVFAGGDMGQDCPALAVLAGDFTSSGTTQIAQLWKSLLA